MKKIYDSIQSRIDADSSDKIKSLLTQLTEYQNKVKTLELEKGQQKEIYQNELKLKK